MCIWNHINGEVFSHLVIFRGFRIRRQTAFSSSEMHFPPSALIKVLTFFKKTLLDQTASDSVSGDHTCAQLFCALHECWPRLLSLDLREKHAQTTETCLKWRRSCRPCAFVIVQFRSRDHIFNMVASMTRENRENDFTAKVFHFLGPCHLKTPWWVKILIMQIKTNDMLCHCSWLQASETSEKLSDFAAIIEEMFDCQSNPNFGADFVTSSYFSHNFLYQRLSVRCLTLTTWTDYITLGKFWKLNNVSLKNSRKTLIILNSWTDKM